MKPTTVFLLIALTATSILLAIGTMTNADQQRTDAIRATVQIQPAQLKALNARLDYLGKTQSDIKAAMKESIKSQHEHAAFDAALDKKIGIPGGAAILKKREEATNRAYRKLEGGK